MRSSSVILFLALAAAQQPEGTVKFAVSTKLVVVNVSVRDRAGRPVEALKAGDFAVFEDDKPQKLAVFEYQRLESSPAAVPAPTAAPSPTSASPAAPSPAVRHKDRRLIVLYFDMSAMPAGDQARALLAAVRFLKEQITPVDLVAVMTYSGRFEIVQDFTDDRLKLLSVITSLRPGEGSELAAEAASGQDEDTAEDTGAAFTADETEFNIFNTDRKLGALESAVKLLAALPEKKALVYFSSGVGKTGVENHSQLRATANAAVRSNVAIYPIDARGLSASAPAGDASRGSPRGSGIYSGAMQRQLQARFNDQQETLHTLAAETGGKALLDNNDLTVGMRQAQQDIGSYYVLGYYSTNPAQDGHFRRIRVKTASQPQAKLDYRSGYFAPKQFGQFTNSDRERQLEEALLLGDPLTELSLAVEIDFFRLARDRYAVPVAVKIPGSQIELAGKRAADSAQLDFAGQVRDSNGRLAGTVRDTLRLKLAESEAAKLGQRHVEYDTALSLRPGDYTLRFVARENTGGKLGTFETKFTVPDLSGENAWLRTSSVVLAGQRTPLPAGARSAENHPLVRGGQKLVPSITRVFRRNQDLYVYFEVYDAKPRISATVSFFRGNNKAFESAAFRVNNEAASRGHPVPVEMRIPLRALGAGKYICQVNVIDEQSEKFAFPRVRMVVLE